MDDTEALFLPAFEEEISKTQERSPSFAKRDWIVTGRPTKDFPDKNDEQWWRVNGPVMTRRYVDWRTAHPWPLWTIGNKPAVELLCNFNLPDGPAVKAYIDRVFVLPNGDLAVCDIKSGSKVPDSNGQLGLYACAIEILYGIRPKWGTYWMARSGKHTELASLDVWTPAVMADMLNGFMRAVSAGHFAPKPSGFCRSCVTQDHCFIVGGTLAADSDPLATVAREAADA